MSNDGMNKERERERAKNNFIIRVPNTIISEAAP